MPSGGLVTLFDQARAIVTRTMNEDTLVGQGATPESLARTRDVRRRGWRRPTGKASLLPRGAGRVDGVDGGAGDAGGRDQRPMRRSFYAITAAGIAIDPQGLSGPSSCGGGWSPRSSRSRPPRDAGAWSCRFGAESSIAELQDLSVALREAAGDPQDAPGGTRRAAAVNRRSVRRRRDRDPGTGTWGI